MQGIKKDNVRPLYELYGHHKSYDKHQKICVEIDLVIKKGAKAESVDAQDRDDGLE